MYKTILVPLDGSKRAERILPHVEQLALSFKAKIIFLHVVESGFVNVTPYPYYSYAAMEREDVERFIQESQAYVSNLQADFAAKGIETEALVAEGMVVKTIIQVAEMQNADLIAMASHGRTGLARVFYGSVAAGILHQVDRPLLIVRSEGDEE